MLIEEIKLPVARYNLALLAKQKGFDNFECRGAYNENKEFYHRSSITVNRSVYKDYPVNGHDIVLAPTLYLLKAWLSQKHYIEISIDCYYNHGWHYQAKINTSNATIDFDYCNLEKECLTEALIYAFKMLKDEK